MRLGGDSSSSAPSTVVSAGSSTEQETRPTPTLVFKPFLVLVAFCAVALFLVYYMEDKVFLRVALFPGVRVDMDVEEELNIVNAMDRIQEPKSYNSLDNKRTHWCVLDHSNTVMLGSFQHASQSLYPCWSWFVEQNATNRCGFVLLDGLRLTNHWVLDLVHAMGCTTNTTIQDGPSFHQSKPLSGLPGSPVEWFSSLNVSKLLRERVIGETARPKIISVQTVGFIQRRKDRRITNFPEIERALSKLLAKSVFDTIFFETMQLEEQAIWMANHDIIVAAHGAGLTNAAFIHPNTIVMELFPPNYYPIGFYQPLIKESGGIALEWHSGNTPVEDNKQHWGERGRWRVADFAPSVDEVVDAIMCSDRVSPPHSLLRGP